MKIDSNTLRLVRALVKLTSAITDIDELKDQKQYKFQIKKELNTWQEWIEEHTKDSLIKLTKANDTIFANLIELYDDFENRFNVKDVYTSRILLLLAKVHSALRDLEQMDLPYNKYIGNLRSKLQFIVNLGSINVYIINHSKEFNNLLGSMNKLSDEQIIGTN